MDTTTSTGSRVRTLPGARLCRFPVDFPGWGAANAADTLLDPQPGLEGVVTGEESHGIAPYTRYGIQFDDGTRSYGTALGVDFEII